MSNETQARIIQSILDTYYSVGAKGLKVGSIAKQCGISRQALHRYHPDLLDYIKGNKAVEDLLPALDSPSIENNLKQSHDKVVQLEHELNNIKKHHKLQLEQELDNHISSLMNADISTYMGDDTRKALEQINALNQEYSNQITALKQQLNNKMVAESKNMILPSRQSKTVLRPGLKAAMTAYSKSKDHKSYSTTKANEIDKIISKAASLITPQTHIIIYIEKYIADLEKIIDRLTPKLPSVIILTLPVFTNAELRLYIRKLSKSPYTSIYIPETTSIAEANAQRSFRAMQAPKEELDLSERCEAFHLTKEINELVHLRIENGN